MIRQVWGEMPTHYAGIDVDAFVVMPNHVHGILWVRDLSGEDRDEPADADATEGAESPDDETPSGLSLPDAMHRFKSLTTARYRHGVADQAWERFHKVLWQRSYNDHAIRDERALRAAREYIENNPLKWALDQENPEVVTRVPKRS